MAVRSARCASWTYEPREPRPDQVDALRILGQQVIMRIELRQQASALAAMVAERERLNNDLRIALAVHQSIINTIGDALLVIGRDGRIMHVNRAFKQLWACPRSWSPLATTSSS